MKPVAVEHEYPAADDQVNIEISLGNTCNYECSYCPPELHDGTLGWHSVDHVKSFLNQVKRQYGRRILIQYTGGEPTVYPGFEDILQYGAELGMTHSIISNGSRTLRWWKRMGKYFDRVHLTFHQEHADIEHFVAVVGALNEHCRVHVNFTMIPELFDEIKAKAELLKEAENTSLTLKPLRIGFGAELYPYTAAQLLWMKEFKSTGTYSESADLRGNMETVYDDGSTSIRRPSQFILDGDNQWEGWSCWAGLQSLTVKPNGDIFRAICKVGGRIGNIRTGFVLPTEPIICTKAACSCVSDVMIKKTKAG